MTPIEIVLATTNPQKLQVIRNEASWPDWIKWQTLADYPNIADAPEEVGSNALENALAKAKFYNEQIGKPVISNDYSFYVDALDYQPGTKPKRFHPGTPKEKLEYFFSMMKDKANRQGRVEVADIFIDNPKNAPVVAHKTFEVVIPKNPRGQEALSGENGFWTRYAAELDGKTMAEIHEQYPEKVPANVVAQMLANEIRDRYEKRSSANHPVDWLMNKEAAMPPAQAKRHLQNIMNLPPLPLTLKDKLIMGSVLGAFPALMLGGLALKDDRLTEL